MSRQSKITKDFNSQTALRVLFFPGPPLTEGQSLLFFNALTLYDFDGHGEAIDLVCHMKWNSCLHANVLYLF